MKSFIIFMLVVQSITVFCMDEPFHGELAKSKKLTEKFKKAFFFNHDLHFTVERILIKKGFSVNSAMNASGDTPLHCAFAHYVYPTIGFWECRRARIAFLLQHGADLERCNYSGDSPFDAAIRGRDTVKLSLFSALGYKFFPASMDQQKDPLALLENKAQLYKELRQKQIEKEINAPQAANTLANLFIFIQNNENHQKLFGRQKPKSCQSIEVKQSGDFFKHTTFADLIQYAGKQAVEFVMQDLNELCADAFDIAQYDSNFFHKIEQEYPFVTIYRERNVIELLKNDAQLFKQLVKSDKSVSAQILLAGFFDALARMQYSSDKDALWYCPENIKTFADLELLVGQNAIQYVKEHLLSIGKKLLHTARNESAQVFRQQALACPFAIQYQHDELFLWFCNRYKGLSRLKDEAHELFNLLLYTYEYAPLLLLSDSEMCSYFEQEERRCEPKPEEESEDSSCPESQDETEYTHRSSEDFMCNMSKVE